MPTATGRPKKPRHDAALRQSDSANGLPGSDAKRTRVVRASTKTNPLGPHVPALSTFSPRSHDPPAPIAGPSSSTSRQPVAAAVAAAAGARHAPERDLKRKVGPQAERDGGTADEDSDEASSDDDVDGDGGGRDNEVEARVNASAGAKHVETSNGQEGCGRAQTAQHDGGRSRPVDLETQPPASNSIRSAWAEMETRRHAGNDPLQIAFARADQAKAAADQARDEERAKCHTIVEAARQEIKAMDEALRKQVVKHHSMKDDLIAQIKDLNDDLEKAKEKAETLDFAQAELKAAKTAAKSIEASLAATSVRERAAQSRADQAVEARRKAEAAQRKAVDAKQQADDARRRAEESLVAAQQTAQRKLEDACREAADALAEVEDRLRLACEQRDAANAELAVFKRDGDVGTGDSNGL